MNPEFVDLDDVLETHDEQIEQYGGTKGIRDLGLLESAIAMPRASFGGEFLHRDLFEMASAYAFHFAENQPFLDGNKRTALAVALLFLDLNEIELDDLDQLLYQAMIDLSARKLDKSGLALLLKKLSDNPVES